jgi:riboflavin-specific deaminase-like protein
VDGPSPIRVIIDSRLRIPIGANVLTDTTSRTIVATTHGASDEAATAIAARGATVLRVHANDDGSVDFLSVLARLRREGITSLLVEGGRGIITSALRAKVIDRLAVTIAPKVVGEGISAVGDLSIDYLRDAVTFAHSRFIQCGDDVVFYGEPANDGAA